MKTPKDILNKKFFVTDIPIIASIAIRFLLAEKQKAGRRVIIC